MVEKAIDTNVRFSCSWNGVAKELDFDTCHPLLYTQNIGWVVRLGYYRYNLGRFRDQVNLFAKKRTLTAPDLSFGLKLHCTRCYPVLASDFRASLKNENPPTRNAFSAWASSWRSNVYKAIPEKIREVEVPFERVPVPSTGYEPRFGYQIKAGVTRLVILDLAPHSKSQGSAFDFARFSERPC